jgi:glycosyltransferase involved in cell wall biosynthesis
MSDAKAAPVRVHLTNVVGAGATRLLESLLPALESQGQVHITEIHLPDRGSLAQYSAHEPGTRTAVYHRLLPNALSRLLECIWLGSKFNGQTPLLVLGDLPLACRAPQTVFVQTPHLAARTRPLWRLDGIKFAVARWVFRRNATRAQAFIVQTAVMQKSLIHAHPTLAGRVHVVAQPVPQWLLVSGLRRHRRARAADSPLSLVYPAALYPHKNHRVLAGVDATTDWPVELVTLTIAAERSPVPGAGWLHCAGFLTPEGILGLYRNADALLFLSTDESYGFPMVEAMFVGLPIVCPELPYARTLCGDEAIYFDPASAASLQAAVVELHRKLRSGWWPDWSEQLRPIPGDWASVARAMLGIACSVATEQVVTQNSQIRHESGL